MSVKNKRQLILAAIWCVARAGLIACFVVDLLIRWDKLPRVRQFMRRAGWYVCCYIVKMHAWHNRFCQEHNERELGQ